MDDDWLIFLADDALAIFQNIRGRGEAEGLSDESVAILAAGVLETRQMMKAGQQ